MQIYYNSKFTPILYKSSEILNTKTKNFINTYFASYEQTITNLKDYDYAGFGTSMSRDCDIYIREYRTLLDN